MKLTKKELHYIHTHPPLVAGIKSLVQIKQEAEAAGMTLFTYMKANKLLPNRNSPAFKLITNLHRG